VDIVELLLKQPGVSVDLPGPLNFTPLHGTPLLHFRFIHSINTKIQLKRNIRKETKYEKEESKVKKSEEQKWREREREKEKEKERNEQSEQRSELIILYCD
jgi:hypothetical protein